MRIRRDVVQLRLHVGSEKDHTKPYLVSGSNFQAGKLSRKTKLS